MLSYPRSSSAGGICWDRVLRYGLNKGAMAQQICCLFLQNNIHMLSYPRSSSISKDLLTWQDVTQNLAMCKVCYVFVRYLADYVCLYHFERQ